MIKASLVAPFLPEMVDHFRDIPDVECVFGAEKDTQVLLGMPDAGTIAACPDLNWIQTTNAGVDGYMAMTELRARRILLTNVSGAFGQSISEWVLTVVLALYKHLPVFRDQQNLCLWKDAGRQDSPVGKKILILGTGDIGTQTADLFRPFGCLLTGMRRHRLPHPAFDRIITPDELDAELPKADIVVCALPGTPETRGLFGEKRLSLLQNNAIIVNVGRGNLIDCDALARILTEGKIRGAALDVTDPEPLPADHPLWKCRNAIVTPHVTGGSFGHLYATERKIIEICRENLRRRAAGECLMNLVDYDTGYRGLAERYSAERKQEYGRT